MNSKKILSGIMAAALAGSVGATAAACGSGASAQDSKTITILAESKDGMQQVVEAYQKKYPNDAVKVSYVSGSDTMEQQEGTQLSAGTAPDIIRIWPGDGGRFSAKQISKSGFAMDLSNESWVSRLTDAERGEVSDDEGKIVVMPFSVASIGALYNMTAMDKAGLKPPTTWSEVKTFCGAAKEKGLVAFGLGYKTLDQTQLIPYALTATLVYGKNPEFDKQMAEGKATFAEGWKESFDKYLEMKDAGCFNESPVGTSGDEITKAVAQGKDLGAVWVSAVGAGLTEMAPEGTQFALFPLPATDNPDDTFLPVSVGAAYGINAKAKNPEGAKRFLEFVASDEGQTTFANGYGQIPAFAADSYQADAVNQPAVDAMAAGKSTPFANEAWPNPEVQKNMFAGIQEMFNGTKSAADVLAQMDADYAKS